MITPARMRLLREVLLKLVVALLHQHHDVARRPIVVGKKLLKRTQCVSPGARSSMTVRVLRFNVTVASSTSTICKG